MEEEVVEGGIKEERSCERIRVWDDRDDLPIEFHD